MNDLLGGADPQHLMLGLLIFIASLALLIGLAGALVVWAFTRNLERDEEQTVSLEEHQALKADRARMNAFGYPVADRKRP